MKIRNLIIIAAVLLVSLVALAITKSSAAYQAGYGAGGLWVNIFKIVGVAGLIFFGVRYIIKEE